jgi:HSP20 family molecular chaperone IbpA
MEIVPNLFKPLDLETCFSELTSFKELYGKSALSYSEDQQSYTVEVALSEANFDPEGVEVSLKDNTLTVQAKYTEEENDPGRRYVKTACRSFSCTTTLPDSVDLSAEPQASCQDGRLTITFAKTVVDEPSNKPKMIMVNRV